MDRSRVAIVIPALNEAKSIASVLAGATPHGTVIVVDDASIDETAAIAREAGAEVVMHERNKGYDAALNSGFRRAAELKKDVIVTLDADGQHDPRLLRRFLDKIDEGCDVVVGVRSRRQRLAEHLFAWYTGLRFGISDPLCGMKAYRTSTYLALGHFDSYCSVGTELALFAAKSGCRVGQIPFVVREREGRSRFGSIVVGNAKIARAMFRSFSGLK